MSVVCTTLSTGSEMPALEAAPVDKSTGGGDVGLDLRLSQLKALFRTQKELLEQRDKQIIYLKQQLQLRAAGVTRRHGTGKAAKKAARKPIVSHVLRAGRRTQLRT